MNILFDYPQDELRKSTKGNLVHSYYLSKNLSRYANLYGIRPNSNPKKIYKETRVNFFTNKYLRLKTKFPTHIIHFIYAIINNKKIDLIYSRYHYSFKQFGLLFKFLFREKLFVVEINGVPWDEERGFKFNKLLKRLLLIPIKMADKLIFVSESIFKEFRNEISDISDKSVIINNGVDTDIFMIKNKSKLRRDYNLKQKGWIITFVGVIERWQGLDILVEVAKRLREERIRLRFLIVGSGRYLDKLKELILRYKLNDYFIFTGEIEQKEVVDYINISDLCISPFVKRRKASPIKIFEYMACGKMVISSKIEDIQSLGIDQGLIYANPGDIDSFVSIIKRVLKKRELKNNNRQIVLKKYGWDSVATKILDNLKIK